MPANDSAVQVRNLTRRFGAFTAVDDVSFDVRSGEIFGFLGANGAGKTTVIRILTALLPPTSGDARVAGLDVRRDAARIKHRIGYMSQKFSLYDDLTVRENLEFYGGVYGLSRAAIRERSEQLLATLQLTGRGDTPTRALPLGWKQRLALGSSLLHRPTILFLDEPTGGVDPISRRAFWRMIQDLSDAGTTVFVTTHYMDEAEYCHRVSIMHQGRIIDIGAPGALKAQYGSATMQDLFLTRLRQHLAEDASGGSPTEASA
jgi:ABC-2 type transport system ATP-binding protein